MNRIIVQMTSLSIVAICVSMIVLADVGTCVPKTIGSDAVKSADCTLLDNFAYIVDTQSVSTSFSWTVHYAETRLSAAITHTPSYTGTGECGVTLFPKVSSDGGIHIEYSLMLRCFPSAEPPSTSVNSWYATVVNYHIATPVMTSPGWAT